MGKDEFIEALGPTEPIEVGKPGALSAVEALATRDWYDQRAAEEVRPTGLRTICPDGGTCHHQCGVSQICFRVDCCEPLSGVYPNDEWPLGVR